LLKYDRASGDWNSPASELCIAELSPSCSGTTKARTP
jgi:hypothetical protein